ncbi:hypothetical protein ACFW9N_33110 [Streptomyces sp. NPDC059496]|uniref:hypothetical protein n=1 Tax=Streptomyces sp. NPDC059496 TaxID=3346851 RepID=UPI00367BCD19
MVHEVDHPKRLDCELLHSPGGFVLSNGQYDQYPDEDTVPLREAFRLVQQIVGTGSWPTDARRVVDR